MLPRLHRIIKPIIDDIFLALLKMKSFADDRFNVTKNTKFRLSYSRKTLWEKEKMLVSSIFSVSNNDSKVSFLIRVVKI